MDRGLGLRRALSDETQSRPFQPLGGEVLHIGWLRTDSDNGKVSRAEGEHDRECLEALLGHYTVARELQEELLNRVERGWSDVTFTLGEGYYCRLQRFSEFDTLTLSGPGSPDDAMDAPVRPWQWMLPEGWLANVPGRVFLCAHVVARHTEPDQYQLLDDDDLWQELQMVTRTVGWEKQTRDDGASYSTVIGTARAEAFTAIAELSELTNTDGGEGSDMGASSSADALGAVAGLSGEHQNAPDDSWRIRMVSTGALELDLALELATGAVGVTSAVRPGDWDKSEEETPIEKKERKDRVKKVSSAFGTEEWQKEKKQQRRREKIKISAAAATENGEDGGIPDSTTQSLSERSEWKSWSTQVESSRIVAFDAGRGVRFYANYHLDQEGAMSCLVLTPRGASVVRAARQMQRFFTIEQYRLLILARLPGAKSRYPALAKLNDQYESVAKAIRRMNSSSKASKENSRRYHQQQEFLEKITDLEQATAQELARAKSEVTIAHAYVEIIRSRFEDSGFKPLGGEVRFLPPFVQKRLDPAVSTITSVAERAQILSDALQRTTGLLQAGVEVRLQRLNERLALYGFVFTVLGVITTVATSVSAGGALAPVFLKLCSWVTSHAGWFRPALAVFGV